MTRVTTKTFSLWSRRDMCCWGNLVCKASVPVKKRANKKKEGEKIHDHMASSLILGTFLWENGATLRSAGKRLLVGFYSDLALPVPCLCVSVTPAPYSLHVRGTVTSGPTALCLFPSCQEV